MKKLSAMDCLAIENAWQHWARPEQIAPDGDWGIWVFLGGRGAGKTRAGAEWVRARIQQGAGRIALVGPSYSDAREVMIDGQSGLLSIGFTSERPRYEISRRRLLWPNGAVGHVFSAQDPDGLRGPQFDAAWADEFCAWHYAEDSLSNLRFGLRLGENPQMVMTSTPRPMPVLRSLLAEDGVVHSKASTLANAAYLSPAFMKSIYDIYGGTRLGRQELSGEILDDQEGALWTRNMIEHNIVHNVPNLEKSSSRLTRPLVQGPRQTNAGSLWQVVCIKT